MIKQRRALEEELSELRENGIDNRDPEVERRLRRDLRRYKALLADAQTMIDHLKSDVVNKQQMRQLKSQVSLLYVALCEKASRGICDYLRFCVVA